MFSKEIHNIVESLTRGVFTARVFDLSNLGCMVLVKNYMIDLHSRS